MVLYVFDLVIVSGVAFLVFCLRRFAQDMRPSHAADQPIVVKKVKPTSVRKQTPIILRPMQRPLRRNTKGLSELARKAR